MTALAHDTSASVWSARVYRVNAWRELQGRPALEFDEDGSIVSGWQSREAIRDAIIKEPKPPEWWTAENTARWEAAVWSGQTEASAAQSIWQNKMTAYVPGLKSRTPPTAKQYKEWAKRRAADPRPTPVTFFDGQVDEKRLQLATAHR